MTSKKFLVFAAGGIIARKDGHILIIHRNKYKDWSLPKGKSKKGEELEKTAIREIKEETGFNVRINGVVDVIGYPFKNKFKIVVFYSMIVTGKQQKLSRFDKTDVAVKWLTIAQALKKLSYPNQKNVLKKFKPKAY